MKTNDVNGDYNPDIEQYNPPSWRKPISTFYEYNGRDHVITGDSTAGDNNQLFQKYSRLV